MDMERLRGWLIANGISADELDNIEPATIKKDVDTLGETAVMSLMSADDLAQTLVMALTRIEALEAEVAVLKGGAA